MANLGTFLAYNNTSSKGDKICLPQSCSDNILNNPNVTYPLCFELSISPSRIDVLNALQNGLPKPQRKYIYAGILEFNAPDNVVLCPPWMMNDLTINDGDKVTICNITLPKGKFVKLRPHNALKDISAKKQLENSLRDFTTLTSETTINVTGMNDIKIDILSVKPMKNQESSKNGIQIIDTDLIVEFDAPINEEKNNRYDSILELNHKLNDNVLLDEYRYYTVNMTENAESVAVSNIEICVVPKNNTDDIDLYVSFKNNEPNLLDQNSYHYHCIDTGNAKILIDMSKHEGQNIRQFYIGVHAFHADSNNTNNNNNNNNNDSKMDEDGIEYELKINYNVIENATGLNRASSLTTQPKNGDLNDAKDKKFCENCQRYVNMWSFDRHVIHCAKQFYHCIKCSKVIKINDKELHIKTYHSDLKCDLCNEIIKGGKSTLISHKKFECLCRPVNCEYCHLPFKFKDLDVHIEACQNRTEKCSICNQYILLKDIKTHFNIVHGSEYIEPTPNINRIKSPEYIEPKTAYFNDDNVMDVDIDRDQQRWACRSCQFINRPFRKQCQICKMDKGNHYQTEQEYLFEKNVRIKNKIHAHDSEDTALSTIDKSNIPKRDYKHMFNGDNNDDNNDTNGNSVKPPLLNYVKKFENNGNNDNDVDMKQDTVVGTKDPSKIPNRDYDHLLNDNNLNENDYIQFDDYIKNVNNPKPEPKKATKLSNSIDNIPMRDYDHMFNNDDNTEYDQTNYNTSNIVENPKKRIKLSSDRANIPTRNYDTLLNNGNNNDVDYVLHIGSDKQTKKDDKSQYWLCSNPNCKFLNKNLRHKCSACRTNRDGSHIETNDIHFDILGLKNKWVCNNCDKINKSTRINCIFCHKRKGFDKSNNFEYNIKRNKSPLFNDTEQWICDKCDTLNKGVHINCWKCKNKRKDDFMIYGKRKSNPDNNKNSSNDNNNENIKQHNIKPSHPLEAKLLGMNYNNIEPPNIKKAINNDTWTCQMCTFINQGSSKNCQICAIPRIHG